MGVLDWTILAALILWAAAAVIWMIRRRKRGAVCCGCSGCDACRPDAASRRESPDGAGKDGGRAACSGSCAACRGCDACRKQ